MSVTHNRAKILFLSHDAEWGGAQSLLYLLLKGLDRQKYEPLVVLPRAGSLEEKIRLLGVPTKLVPLEWATGDTPTDWYRHNKFATNLRTRVNEVVELIRQEQIDLVFSNTGVILEGALAARLCGLPHIWHILEIFSLDPKLFPLLDLPGFYGLLNDLSDVLIVGSKAAQMEIEQFIQTKKIQIIYAGVDIPAQENICQDKKKVLGLNPDIPVISFVGLLSKRKGALSLAETASLIIQKFPGVKFIIVGQDDGILQDMQTQITERGLNHVFDFLGFRSDYLDIVASSDMLVVPSLVDTLPLIVLDAMKVGKPVIASQCGGMSEMIVEGETGLLVPVGDPPAMAQAIISLLEAPSQGKIMGERGRQRAVTLFNSNQFAPNFEQVFDRLIASGKSEANQANSRLINSFLAMLEVADTARNQAHASQPAITTTTDFFKRLAQNESPYQAYEIKPARPALSPKDTENYKVSVCIPVYNGADYVAEAITSILNQTFPDFELIVVDDCSADTTEAVIKSIHDSRIKYVKNQNRLGLVGNWNKCLELATSPYVYIFHQDDCMLPENLAQKINILDENPAVGLVYSKVLTIDALGNVTGQDWFARTEPDTDFVMPGSDFFEMLISGLNIISCPSVMVRRNCYEQLGGFDHRLPFTADWEMWLRIALFCDVAYLATPLIKYRFHAGNETHNFKELRELEQYYQCRKIILEKYPERIPNCHALRIRLARENEQKAYDWAYHYYQQKRYTEAREALAFALAVQTDMAKSIWGQDYMLWFLGTIENLKSGTSPSVEPLSFQEKLNTLSGEDIAQRVSIRKLIKAIGFKIAKQPGFRWLYHYRYLGKKVLGGS